MLVVFVRFIGTVPVYTVVAPTSNFVRKVALIDFASLLIKTIGQTMIARHWLDTRLRSSRAARDCLLYAFGKSL